MADAIQVLSGSVNGKGIKVTGTATGASVTVHTAAAGVVTTDYVMLMAANNDVDGETRTLVLEWGGATDPDFVIRIPIPAKVGFVPICERIPINNGLAVKAWLETEADDVSIYGHAIRV